jgi:hypothetical protein
MRIGRSGFTLADLQVIALRGGNYELDVKKDPELHKWVIEATITNESTGQKTTDFLMTQRKSKKTFKELEGALVFAQDYCVGIEKVCITIEGKEWMYERIKQKQSDG